MSCCKINKDTSSSIKELDTLANYFDEVTVEKQENYNLLTLKDKANHPNYDWTVWLSCRVQLDDPISKNRKSYDSYNSADYYMQNVCERILDWIDCLKKDEQKAQQLSLFGLEEDSEIEEMPPRPTKSNEWSEYFKESIRVTKANKMKKYDFLELVHLDYYTYSDIDHRKSLPSTEEVRELLKSAIIKGTREPGRYKDFWFDNPFYIFREIALSDYELMSRLGHIRLFLVPYIEYPWVFSDDSFNGDIHDKEISHRFYLDGTELTISGSHDNDKYDLPIYSDLYNDELLSWVREFYGIEDKEIIEDEEALRLEISSYFNGLDKNFDFQHQINISKDWKAFKSVVFNIVKEKNINTTGGGSGAVWLDGFKGHYSDKFSKKGSITITQDAKLRESIGRDITELNRWDEAIIYDLKGDELFKKAFELFNKKASVKQLTLFNLMAA